MNRSENIAELTAALAKAQGEIKGAVKDAANPFFRSTYADLASVWDAIREPLSRNGLAVMQFPEECDKGLSVYTMLSHSSGEWVASSLLVRPGYTDKEGNFVELSDPQAMGSAITYARRYALQAVAGVAPVDDDGNAASGRGGAATHSERAMERTDNRREAAARRQTPQDPVQESTGNWKDVICHIGKPSGPIRGKKLGQIDDGARAYLLKSLREKDQSKLPIADRRLLAALCVWEGEQGVDQRRPEDQEPGESVAGAETGTPEGQSSALTEATKAILGILEWNAIPVETFFTVANRRQWTMATGFAGITEPEAVRMQANIEKVVEHCLNEMKPAATEGGEA